MATPSAQERLFQELLERFGPKIAGAFRAAVDDLRSNAELQKFIASFERGDIEGAIKALHIDEAAFGPLQDALQETYAAGGQMGLDALPSRSPDGVALVLRFNARNPRAEAQLRDHSSMLVTNATEEMKQAVRQHLVTRMAEGANPKVTGLDVVGRVSRVSGKREGGILGLTTEQEGWARRYEAEIADTPDPNALTRKLRDKRFDRTVAKAIREGRPIAAETQAKMVAAYRNRTLRLRGETIGRTEAMTALHAAQHESLRQAVESGSIQASQVRRTWRSAHDPRVRLTHAVLDGDTVGLDERFKSPSGARLLFPGDPAAPASEVIGCRCAVSVRVDWLANL